MNPLHVTQLRPAFSLLRIASPLPLQDADVRALIRRYDTNGDGQVSYHEFAKLMELDESDIAELAEKLRQGLRNAVRVSHDAQNTLKSLMECIA